MLQQTVSTHAPLAGSDRSAATVSCFFPVSTHAPLAGSDVNLPAGVVAGHQFQPTLPLRGATSRCPWGCVRACRFNPRSPCGERLVYRANWWLRSVFQPTLPLRGATELKKNSEAWKKFQPTLPLRGATHRVRNRQLCGIVSTHAPLAGSDSKNRYSTHRLKSFNPRSPCGERLPVAIVGPVVGVSTHAPLAGSDERSASRLKVWHVSTHAPLAGSDGPRRHPAV